MPADRARPLTAKVKEYRADLASLREQLKTAAAAAGASDAARAELVRRRFFFLPALCLHPFIVVVLHGCSRLAVCAVCFRTTPIIAPLSPRAHSHKHTHT